MNINATPETIRIVAEMFTLAAFLDDRIAKADQGRIAAWSEQLQRHNLTREDILDGLQNFYDNDPKARDRAIGIADLTQHARACKRSRLDKEADTEREARQATHDATKPAPDETQQLATEIVMQPIAAASRTPRLFEAEHALQRCHGRQESIDAIREYNAAKRQAHKTIPTRP